MTRLVYCTFNKAVVTDETTALVWTVVLHLMYCSINLHCAQWQSQKWNSPAFCVNQGEAVGLDDTLSI